MREEEHGSGEDPPSLESLRAAPAPTPAEEAYTEYLDRLDRGESPDFEAWLADHRGLERELRALHERWGSVHSAVVRLGIGAARVPEGSAAARVLLERLAARRRGLDAEGRYRERDEVARGGMGRVLEVWDEDLERSLAMKVLLSAGRDGAGGLGRFLEEARVTGQLDHPGIVPVHELGLDAQGRLFFTMRLVEGDHLGTILEKARRGAGGWTRTRVLGVLLRVCEAMAYAHEKGVVHRDLKPTNVMVGRFGEVYVMDWGLARVMGRRDAPEGGDASLRPLDDSPLRTVEGDVVGTPCYMSPEQARGRHAELGPASDVYSVGAMLYELLTGRAPYLPEGGGSLPSAAIVARVLDGPPDSLASQARDASPELVSICERAMAREPAARYPDMGAMAEDLRAFLENRVVRAHRTGALVELRKWVARNRAVAASLAALIAVALAASLWIAWAERRRSETDRRLADLGLAQELVSSFEARGPVAPEHLAERELWLERAGELESRRLLVADELAALRERALPFDEDEIARAREESPLREEIQVLEQFFVDWERFRGEKEQQGAGGPTLDGEIHRRAFAFWDAGHGRVKREELSALREQLERLEPPLRFESPQDRLRYANLVRFEEQMRRLLEPGGMRDRMADEVERIHLAEQALSLEYSRDWELAIEDISTTRTYGFSLAPQHGLVPLGVDEASGLWEFWHVPSGERPRPRTAGPGWEIEAETGIVLVLIPGGEVLMGAQGDEPSAPRYFPLAEETEGVLLRVRLDPFFLSKYEMTQGQWLRLTGENPSSYRIGELWPVMGFVTPDYPVDGMFDLEALALWGLGLPTEPQWEYACRAGTDTAWWFGDRFADGSSSVNWNLQNISHLPASVQVVLHGPRDPFLLLAPVDSMRPNGFGLLHVTGNLWEWCRGVYPETYEGVTFANGNGELDERERVIPRFLPARGGSFLSESIQLCSFRRGAYLPGERLVGIRPSRAIDH